MMMMKTVAFLSWFGTLHSSVQLFYCTQLVEKSLPCPFFLLSLGAEQHCDQHSLLTVVIHHPPDTSQSVTTRKEVYTNNILTLLQTLYLILMVCFSVAFVF